MNSDIREVADLTYSKSRRRSPFSKKFVSQIAPRLIMQPKQKAVHLNAVAQLVHKLEPEASQLQ